MFHSVRQIFGHETPPAYLQPFQFGWLAVGCFIVLSGYCLTLPATDTGRLNISNLQFFWKRSWRILPPYWLALLFSLGCLWLFGDEPSGRAWMSSGHVTWASTIRTATMTQNFAPQVLDGKVNYCFWSIAAEYQIYFLFPALLWLGRKIGWPLAALGVFAASVALQLASDHTMFYMGPTLLFVGLFTLGSAFCRMRLAAQIWASLAAIGWAAAIAYCSYFGPAGVFNPHYPPFMIAQALAGFAVGSTMGLCSSWQPAWNALGWKPLEWLGQSSYSLYLLHAPILSILFGWVIYPNLKGQDVQWIVLAALALPLSILASRVFYKYCEKPFQKAPRLGVRLDPAPDLSAVSSSHATIGARRGSSAVAAVRD